MSFLGHFRMPTVTFSAMMQTRSRRGFCSRSAALPPCKRSPSGHGERPPSAMRHRSQCHWLSDPTIQFVNSSFFHALMAPEGLPTGNCGGRALVDSCGGLQTIPRGSVCSAHGVKTEQVARGEDRSDTRAALGTEECHHEPACRGQVLASIKIKDNLSTLGHLLIQ